MSQISFEFFPAFCNNMALHYFSVTQCLWLNKCFACCNKVNYRAQGEEGKVCTNILGSTFLNKH